MFGLTDNNWLNAIEEKLNSLSAPLIEILQNSYTIARDKYPNISVVSVCILALGLFLKSCCARKNKNKRRKQLENTVEGIAETAKDQAKAFRNQAVVLSAFRKNLNEIREDINYQARSKKKLVSFQKNISSINQSIASISSNLHEQRELAELRRLDELKQNSQRIRKRT